MTHYLLEGLNREQAEAVQYPGKKLLVLAGAGSGKTRTLTQRIAWAINELQIPSHTILATTFTNKAAREMKERLSQLLGEGTRLPWCGTLHANALQILRYNYEAIGLTPDFSVIDQDEKKVTLKAILKSYGVEDDRAKVNQLSSWISNLKNQGLRSAQAAAGQHKPLDRNLLQAYIDYERICIRDQLVDFDEILLRSYEFLQSDSEAAQITRQRFQALFIDEFQDINSLQSLWLKQLQEHPDVMVSAVGDDDQSIYSWRGAKIAVMRDYGDEPDAKIIRLEQNYRSTSTILNLANALIQHNSNRLGKKLWSAIKSDTKPNGYAAFSEYDEARFISRRINDIRFNTTDDSLNDIAILYRTSAQSRVLEQVLSEEAISYRIYGGLRFFERLEIRDVLAYLRLAYGEQDASIMRTINNPARGIGAKSIEQLNQLSVANNCDLWTTIDNLVTATEGQAGSEPSLERSLNRLAQKIRPFWQVIQDLRQHCPTLPLDQQIEFITEHTGLYQLHCGPNSAAADVRRENLEELQQAAGRRQAQELVPTDDDGANGIDDGINDAINSELSVAQKFLAEVTLEQDHESDAVQQAISMMTIHAAKGLEFQHVFVVGLEEGLMPHDRSIKEGSVEEERRLCYVAVTRAQKHLTLSYARNRSTYGETKMRQGSRFIRELGEEHIQWINQKSRLSTTAGTSGASGNPRFTPLPDAAPKKPKQAADGYYEGCRIEHARFGDGTIMSIHRGSDNSKCEVYFDTGVTKWLLLSPKFLTKISHED